MSYASACTVLHEETFMRSTSPLSVHGALLVSRNPSTVRQHLKLAWPPSSCPDLPFRNRVRVWMMQQRLQSDNSLASFERKKPTTAKEPEPLSTKKETNQIPLSAVVLLVGIKYAQFYYQLYCMILKKSKLTSCQRTVAGTTSRRIGLSLVRRLCVFQPTTSRCLSLHLLC